MWVKGKLEEMVVYPEASNTHAYILAEYKVHLDIPMWPSNTMVDSQALSGRQNEVAKPTAPLWALFEVITNTG